MPNYWFDGTHHHLRLWHWTIRFRWPPWKRTRASCYREVHEAIEKRRRA